MDELHLTPLELINRIAALVPLPRTHRHGYFGVLAPNSPLRAAATALATPIQPATVGHTAPAAAAPPDNAHPKRPSPCHPIALRGLRPYGRHLIVGYSSGGISQIPANYILLKQVSVTGVSFRQCAQDTPAVARAGIRTLLEMWTAGKLRPHVSAVHPLVRFFDAPGALSSRSAIGKHLVLVAAT